MPLSNRRQWNPDALPVRRLIKPPEPVRVDPWTAHAREIAYRLASIENSAAEAHLAAGQGPDTDLLTFRLEFVGGLADAKIWISLSFPNRSVDQPPRSGDNALRCRARPAVGFPSAGSRLSRRRFD